MTDGYLYRSDSLNCLRAQAGDPWLRARRIRSMPDFFPHQQLVEPLNLVQPGQGVFRLSMWRTLRHAMADLAAQLRMAQIGVPPPYGPLVLQRIRADHPMFHTYQRGDDEYLTGQAWLFWNTESCEDTRDWSTVGISHDDIEVFHPAGAWMPYAQWVTTWEAPPPVAAGWTRIELPPACNGDPARFLDARWVDIVADTQSGAARGIFARVPVWSPGVWPADWWTLQMLTPALVSAFPEFVEAGSLSIAVERTGYTQHYDVTVARTPAQRPGWFARTFRGATGSSASVSLTDAEPTGAGARVKAYTSAGLDPASTNTSAYLYNSESLARLARELADRAAHER